MLRINRILVPFDFSDHAETALMHALELAKLHDAHTDVLYVVEVIATPRIDEKGHLELHSDHDPSVLEPSRKALEHRLKALKVDVAVHVERGAAAEQIKVFTEKNEVDLIVMASHGISGLRARFMGSVSRVVLEDVSCPVLLLKSYGRSLLEENVETEEKAG